MIDYVADRSARHTNISTRTSTRRGRRFRRPHAARQPP
jgi:hypothetical protein